MTVPDIEIKRAYDTVGPDDGYRILVDRLWPRGIKKENLKLDLWPKDLIAVSTELREWFHEDEENRWNEFKQRYENELEKDPGLPEFLNDIKSKKKVTLLYGSKDTVHNQAVVLKEFLQKKLK
ncbi:MAG: DUF488 family protein [Bacteroidales bacterium]|nr:DUF488 family protein [Bacteroidales bacterium]